MQILFLILVTDLPPSIALGMEPGEPGILKLRLELMTDGQNTGLSTPKGEEGLQNVPQDSCQIGQLGALPAAVFKCF